MSMPPVHPAAELFPMMSTAELTDLADDIRRNGLRHPVVMFGPRILDGRNRWMACGMAGVEPRMGDWTGTEEQAIDYALSANLKRRHLGPAQKAAIAAAAVPLFEAAAKGRQKHHGGTAPGKKSLTVNSSVSDTRDNRTATAQAARATGAGVAATKTMKAVSDKAPEVLDLAKQGKVKVAEALASKPLSRWPPSGFVRRNTAMKMRLVTGHIERDSPPHQPMGVASSLVCRFPHASNRSRMTLDVRVHIIGFMKTTSCKAVGFSLDGEMQRELAETQAQLEAATGLRVGKSAALRVIFRRAKANAQAALQEPQEAV